MVHTSIDEDYSPKVFLLTAISGELGKLVKYFVEAVIGSNTSTMIVLPLPSTPKLGMSFPLRQTWQFMKRDYICVNTLWL